MRSPFWVWEVLVSKTSTNGTKELPGAKLKVVKGTSEDGEVIAEWTSTEEQKQIAVEDGIYTLIETTAPNGYDIAESITFRVTSTDTSYKVEVQQTNGTYVEVENSTVHMEDAPLFDVPFSKVEVNQTKELPGATLKVVKGEDENGEVVEEWTSSEEQKVIKLREGTYTMIETQAPLGYDVAESITFKVVAKEEGYTLQIKQTDGTFASITENHIRMEDALKEYDVEVSKTEINKTDELPGATLKIVKGEDENGEVVKEWISTTEREVVKLTQGTYTLIETTAPNGYEIAESITFKVVPTSESEFKLQIKQTDGTFVDSTENHVHMEDALSEFALNILKTNDKGETVVLTDAEFTLYADKELKNVLATGTTDETGHLVFEKLIRGTTYYLKETKAPDGYRIPELQNGEDVVYTIKVENEDGQAKYTVTLPGEVTGNDPLLIGTTKTLTYYENGQSNSDSTIGSMSFNEDHELTVNLHVINPVMAKLPATGSSMMLILICLGVALMGGAIALDRKKKKA